MVYCRAIQYPPPPGHLEKILYFNFSNMVVTLQSLIIKKNQSPLPMLTNFRNIRSLSTTKTAKSKAPKLLFKAYFNNLNLERKN
jgi:hypothetical protein